MPHLLPILLKARQACCLVNGKQPILKPSCPSPSGRAALSSSYQILLTPSTRTADAAADGSLISFLLALDLGWHCLAKPVTVRLRSYLTIEESSLIFFLLFNCACFA